MGVAVFLAMILGSYHVDDPGWSRTGLGDTLHNVGGPVGAWFADILLYLFGASAYWLILLALYLVWWGYRRIGDSQSNIITVLVCCC